MPEVQARSYANPRRLPRRNHYQEGPGFLFVATQGGRPPDDLSPSRPAAIVRRRRAALRRWAAGEPLETVCAELGCSRASLFRWRSRYATGGLAGLLDRPPGRPRERAAAGPRAAHPDRPAADLLEQPPSGRRVPPPWRLAPEPRPGRPPPWPATARTVRATSGPGPRYERAAVNELWHIDLKGPFYLLGATGRARTCHFVALVDDHSRFLLGIRAVPTKEAVWVLALLEEAIELCGVPHELMSDNGTPFVAIVRRILSRFQRSLAELRIRHIRTQIDTPWTNGKVEAFWASLQREVLDRQQLADLAAAEAAVTAYAGYYNDHRLHGELDWQTPAERFDGTPFTDRGFASVPVAGPGR